jgi:glycosyltransferase involved in cell wall biosynthesis
MTLNSQVRDSEGGARAVQPSPTPVTRRSELAPPEDGSGGRIVLVTDAWHPQVNGVVNTWTYMQRELAALGRWLDVISPQGSRGVRAPGEPDLILSTEPFAHVTRGLGVEPPAALHIATEGPLGFAARRIALKRGWQFTTSYHTRFPEYFEARFGLPARLTYSVVRRFHRPSRQILVATEAMRRELESRGFERTRIWSRGVDTAVFAPGTRDALDLPRPIFLYAGRVAPEKGLDAFLSLDLPGSKVVVGDGPDLARLQAAWPRAHWLGRRAHDTLGALYDAADVFVFPSRTDTFGLVMLEAIACGCPVAAFPVTGPIDVVTHGVNGVLDELRSACLRALELDRARVRASALQHQWRAIAEELLTILVPLVPEPVTWSPATRAPVAGNAR